MFLNGLQNQFFRTIFSVGSGCPIAMYYWETATFTMPNRILLRQLLFIHHLETLPENSLASEVLFIQKKYKLPGLWSECYDIQKN